MHMALMNDSVGATFDELQRDGFVSCIAQLCTEIFGLDPPALTTLGTQDIHLLDVSCAKVRANHIVHPVIIKMCNFCWPFE